ncbi:MAG TPA: ECF transporter S component [Anaerolineales bacterium]|nr:ECF transporter S component [Anaerolineales bacterium]
MKNRWLSPIIYLVCSLVGILSLLYPFVLPQVTTGAQSGQQRSADMPLMLSVLLGLALIVLVYEVQGQGMSTKLIALLGVLVAINAALRFLDIAIPVPGGFSPIFFLIILTGHVYGARFGFLMGVMTLVVSAILTGGVGPWLPGQMFAAGWVGMSAPLLRPLVRRLQLEGRSEEVWILAGFGALWGLFFGVIMNLWTWPFIAGPADQYWTQGAGIGETIRRYASYYLATSLIWDLARAAGNFLIILGFGLPALRALRRFKRRFTFTVAQPPVTMVP